MFKIFNPITGLYEIAKDEVSAKTLWSQIVNSTKMHFLITPSPIAGEYLYEQEWVNDFKVAWKFYCEKLNKVHTDVLNELETIQLPLIASHAVYNISTESKRSNTFMYFDDNAKPWHIKVLNGQVSDWYEYMAELNGEQYEWVAYDLITGDPIEVYDRLDDVTLSKRNLVNPDTTKVITKLMPLEKMPQEIQDAVVNLEYKDTIYAYSCKEYGLIVEYHPPCLLPENTWPSDVRFEYTNLKEIATFEANRIAKDLVHVVKVEKDSEGNEVWLNHALNV